MKAVKLLLFMVGFAVALLCASPANADVHIWVGGNTDCTSQGYMSVAGANPNDNNIPINYGTCDGVFAPFLGSTTPPDAIQQGVDATRQAWDQHCVNTSESCTLHGFSVGAAPVSIVGNDVGADRPGSNTHVITDGNAWAMPGVFGGDPGLVGTFINIGAPVIGVPTHIDQVPNSENRLNVNDAWANDAGQPPWAEITNLATLNGANGIPPQHIAPLGNPSNTFVTPDRVRQEVYGEPFPGVMNPVDNPVLNSPPVRLTVPSFVGELPCDGGYFTPGDAPC